IRLFFVTTQYPYGGQLWQSDGTEAGTTQVQPSDPSVALRAGELENVNGTLYFYGSSLIDQMGTRSIGLWKTNGTPASTVEVKSFHTGLGDYPVPAHLTAAGDKVFFNGDIANHLWVSDGINTRQVGSVQTTLVSQAYATVGGTLFFDGADGTGDAELWASDGTDGGTTRVKNINVIGSSNPSSLVALGNTVYFAADSGQSLALWKSNGTDAGTALVQEINWPPAGLHDPSTYSPPLSAQMRDAGGKLFFPADDGAHGVELWTSDGSAGGTRLVKDLSATANGYPRDLVARNGT